MKSEAEWFRTFRSQNAFRLTQSLKDQMEQKLDEFEPKMKFRAKQAERPLRRIFHARIAYDPNWLIQSLLES
ncbi:unnamed protein product [Rhodiola kirilowii]